jgi:hypothetical protein
MVLDRISRLTIIRPPTGTARIKTHAGMPKEVISPLDKE